MPDEHSTFTIVTGDAALAQLHDEAYLSQWRRVFDACPWVTTCQRAEFIRTYWKTFRDGIEPILVEQRAADGRLTGVLPLVRNDEGLTGATQWDSEYHCWITTPELGESFMPGALEALAARFRSSQLTLQYLPIGAPLDWVHARSRIASWCQLPEYEHQVLPMPQPETIDAMIRRKPNFKKKRHLLSRQGDFEVRDVRTHDDLHWFLEEFGLLFDFRRGAQYRVSAFRGNPARKEFYEALLDIPGLMTVSAMTLDKQFVAGHLGWTGHNHWFHLGGITHDPFRSKQSPGFTMLGEVICAAAKQGHTLFDLTPGADAYKRVWGAENRVAYSLTARFSNASRIKQRISAVVSGTKHAVASALPDGVRAALRGRRSNFSDVTARLHRIAQYSEPAPAMWNTNRIADLINHPINAPDYWTTIEAAQKYIAGGATMFTSVADGQLLAAWFLIGPLHKTSAAASLPNISPVTMILVGIGSSASAGGMVQSLDAATREKLLVARLPGQSTDGLEATEWSISIEALLKSGTADGVGVAARPSQAGTT